LVDRPSHHFDKLATAKAEIDISVIFSFQDVGIAGCSVFERSINVAVEDTSPYALPLDCVDVVFFAAQLVWPLVAQRLVGIIHLLRKGLGRLNVAIVSKILAHEIFDQDVLVVAKIGRGNARLTDFVQRGPLVLENHSINVKGEWLASKVNSKMFIGSLHPD
jgi:hypothetical protein